MSDKKKCSVCGEEKEEKEYQPSVCTVGREGIESR